MQYKTAEVTARCKGLTRVNIYKNRVKLAAGLPVLPNREALQVSNAQHCAARCSCFLSAAAPKQTLAGLSSCSLHVVIQQDAIWSSSQELLPSAGGADALVLYAGQHWA